MTTISNLPQDLVEEILSRVPPLRAVRSTCKRWNGLSKHPSFAKKYCTKEKEFMVIMENDLNLLLMSVNLHNHKDLIDPPSIKRIGKFNQVQITKAFHCDGLLLCLTFRGAYHNPRLMVWNPYSGQNRWIKPRTTYVAWDLYGIGYDNNKNHKILRVLSLRWSIPTHRQNIKHEIYDLKSNSWRVLTDSLSVVSFNENAVSVKGNIYFSIRTEVDNAKRHLVCFDFTRERFGPPLPLPVHSSADVVLSSVREEKLAVLVRRTIWITDKIEPNTVSWNKFLECDTEILTTGLSFEIKRISFFIDEERKVAMICGLEWRRLYHHDSNIIIGEDGYFKEVDLLRTNHIVFSNYVPSLVQINQPSTIWKRMRSLLCLSS